MFTAHMDLLNFEVFLSRTVYCTHVAQIIIIHGGGMSC